MLGGFDCIIRLQVTVVCADISVYIKHCYLSIMVDEFKRSSELVTTGIVC
jgi:hypothetical protein